VAELMATNRIHRRCPHCSVNLRAGFVVCPTCKGKCFFEKAEQVVEVIEGKNGQPSRKRVTLRPVKKPCPQCHGFGYIICPYCHGGGRDFGEVGDLERPVFVSMLREQIGKLEESRRALELDVLTAKLNVLNEEARINGLQREILRKTNDLLYLLGFPVGMTGAAVQGEVELFDLSPEEAVRLALRRSSSVARARAEASEQARETREVLWEFAPELGLQAGWKDDRNAAGVEVETTEGLYAVSTFAEAHSDPFDGLLEAEIDLLDEEEEGWFLGLTVELPIFEGMGRKGLLIREKAKLEEALHTLRDTVDNLELQVRKRYQSMLERRKEVDILRETVNISRKRLRVQERLKELGKISDNELETFRNRFFQDQDAYFTEQIRWIEAQEDLRFEMRFFEPLPEE